MSMSEIVEKGEVKACESEKGFLVSSSELVGKLEHLSKNKC